MNADGTLPTYTSTSPPADYDEFFAERYGRLVRALTIAFGDREAAADAAQEAFLRAYVRWWRVKRLGDPAGWVRRVAVNLLIDESRRRAPRDRALAKLAAERSSVEMTAADDELNQQLAALPQQQRIALSLFYLEDLSINEVAQAMSLSAGTVKYHLNQGRNSLRNSLSGVGT